MLNNPKKLAIRAARRVTGRTIAGFVRNDAGVSAVEMALVTPILLMIFMGMIDYATAIFNKMELTSGVRAGAQYALINKTSMANIEAAVDGSTNLTGNVATAVTACECDDGTSVICGNTCLTGQVRKYVTITNSYDVTPIFLPGPISLQSTSTIRVE